ncbi:biotin/lipoyl-binding protein [Streptomyces sp. Je 1-4]|uniref:ATP-binding protein n=1 Tax=Streptomyces TaxID=1883 RepID=UPI0021D8818E|nr:MULTISPECIES: biotin carboxylase N-terminal domain-containing protein [unclassified Streptomyces]UYB39055.1 biotin/lipoyl-binding protein [Streptomyces sp. Je 1-4]UZQ35055.1 biotin/lipoyl-binding protein [Streptomyces sp. Je 1-4] [Streptomyces sp. Je 1-4 4N24]UZQ42473.1 biotin/lipoyl-binding protein [Streptomyces sp. Je 1-4] [Streptomyces sp. Je 1-4 4N24_ara]
MSTVRSLLVANRGEIARRVFRTARAMGIRTVAVFSEADADAPHVHDADVAVPLGGFTSAESYLDIGKVLDAVRRSGADAVHPGYGFLSENADFARACAKAGVLFVGPAPESITAMGLKDRAKDIARRAGVPVLPDAVIDGDDKDAWRAAGDGVGYPLLVKATAGGGGKGMRRVDTPKQLVDAVASARREASSSFGNPTVFCERYLAAARHIEIQVFGDAHGNAVHLGERECSVQRRHQKVLEESPSSAVGPKLREAIGKTAVSLVAELNYLGAGTVEYLLDDATGRYFFLEMNTRLQVEHPVTEEVTGVDLVRLQLEVAQGRPLSITQDEITPRGHAIEVRLYAEDTTRDYLPTPGPLHRYFHPDLPGVRYEDGVAAPGEVSAFYDPMLAKIIACADTREEAAARLANALDATQVHGTITNRESLAALLRDPDFLAGATRTNFLDTHPTLLDPPPAVPQIVHLAAAVAVTAARRRATAAVATQAAPGFRLLPGSPLTSSTWTGPDGSERAVGYALAAASADTDLVVDVDGERHQLSLHGLDTDGVRVCHDGLAHPCTVACYADGTVWVNSPGAQSLWKPASRLPDPVAVTAVGGPVSDLPGTVVAVRVAPGDRIKAGQTLVVLEAMKMEHAALAEGPGVVQSVHVEVGQYVEAKAALVTLTREDLS